MTAHIGSLEAVLLFLPVFNVLESLYALSLPPPTPVASPPRATVSVAPPASGKTSTPAQRRLRGMPTSLPKVRRTMVLLSRLTQVSQIGPLPSTPSRGGLSHLAASTSTLNHSLSSSFGPGDLSFGSSTSSTWSSPAINSSPLAPYSGRHSTRVGRKFISSPASALANRYCVGPINRQSLSRLLPQPDDE